MKLLLLLFSILLLPATGFAGDPCYPDQTPHDTPEECDDIAELQWGGVTPADIDPGGTGTVTVLNGLPPFIFEINGSGFTFENDPAPLPGDRHRTVRAGTCGTATVTVTDACKKQVKGQVYSSNGEWQIVEDYNGECILSGPASENCVGNKGYRFSIIEGSYRLDQLSNRTYGTGSMNTKTYCHNCPEPAPESKESCFSGWFNSCGICEHNWSQGDYCMIHPHYCQIFTYLGTYCYQHEKTLYHWVCPEN